MTVFIIAIVVIGYLLIATESLTDVNKAAVAMFAGAVGWVLYICYGTDYVMQVHADEYATFLDGAEATSVTVKEFIAQHIFLKYVGRAAEVVLFLLSTMTIVEILSNNGCFDFLTQLLKTRRSRKMLWTLSLMTFLLSANLDNLTTTVMMLTIMHKMIPARRQRMILGSAIVIAANCGGALTVIGDTTGLVLWNKGAVTATNFSMSLLVPCLCAWLIPTWWLGRMLPERIDTEWHAMPYRGDDTNLNVWQRFLMLVVGIGGLWFIPTFHDITKLSPFLGAGCVLAVLWIVNEAFNHKLMRSEQMAQRRMPVILRYGSLQLMLFVMGILLAVGAVEETGALSAASAWLKTHADNVWLMGLCAGAMSLVVDSFATAVSWFSFFDAEEWVPQTVSDYGPAFAQNGIFWKIIAYCTAVGGTILPVGSASGLALVKMERLHVGWYFAHVGWKVLLSGLVGLAVFWLMFS